MKTNTTLDPVHTHEGAVANRVSPKEELRRAVLTCLLWEDSSYESGNALADRIEALCKVVAPKDIAYLAIEARNEMHLRHAPLFLVRQLARRTKEPYNACAGNDVKVGHVLPTILSGIIQRADELGEFLALYWKDGKDQPIANSVKRGLAEAFHKFNEYQFAKYDREGVVKLRDVMFLTHPKPSHSLYAEGIKEKEEALFKRIADRTLATPDTWEVELSAGKDKKETFERLLKEKKLGGMAVLRNLRNMVQSGVDEQLIRDRMRDGIARALPFRFITAARHVPKFEDILEQAMFQGIQELPSLPGRTGLLIDVSGSMDGKLSHKGEATRMDAAAGLAVLLREKAEAVDVATFSCQAVIVPPRRGFALRDAIYISQPHGATYLGEAINALTLPWAHIDRLIVITDEQSASPIGTPWCPKAYIINVATYEHGIGYGSGWTHINGWSDRIVDYIAAIETTEPGAGGQ